MSAPPAGPTIASAGAQARGPDATATRAEAARARQHQRGITTILVVMLVGLALTATALGVAHSVRGAQDKALAVHTATLAQQRTWAGVELVRQYLQTANLSAPAWTTLPWTIPATGIDSSAISARLVEVSGPDADGNYRVTADVNGSGDGATATLRTIYHVTRPASTGGSTSSGPAIDVANFYYDLNMSGGIVVKGDSSANFNVMGNVTLDNASIIGINAINATGNISIGSGIKVNQIYSNGNVTLSGSSAMQSVSALGNVIDNSSGAQGVINSNGTVTISNGSANTVNAMGAVSAASGGTHGTINTNGNLTVSNGVVNTANVGGNVTVTSGTIKTTNTLGTVSWTSTGTGAVAINANSSILYAAAGGALSARGDVTLTGGGAGSVRTLGNTYVRSYGGIPLLQGKGNLQVDQYAAVTGTIGGTLTKLQQWNTSVLVTILAGFLPTGVNTVALTPVAALQPYTLTRPVVDAYALKSSANYVFEYQSAGYTRVSVQNIAGISAGSYALVSDATRKDFLCPLASFNTTAKTCATAGNLLKTICEGYSTDNSCFTYSKPGTVDKWTIAGISLAPGAYWFDGDLEASTGIYFNTFLATGHISTSGAHITKSPNTAGYGAICANTPTDGVAKTAFFAGLYPTNFCNVIAGTLTLDSLGNIAMLAGGFKNGVFSGGNITLGASTKVYGTIVAGNLFNSGGSTTVYGYVAAAGQAALSGANALGGSTTLDLTSLPVTFTPDALPCTSNCTATVAPTGEASVLWVRYL